MFIGVTSLHLFSLHFLHRWIASQFLAASRLTILAHGTRFYGPNAKKKRRTRPMSSHLNLISLVNKGFIIRKITQRLREQSGQSRAGKIQCRPIPLG